MAQPREGKQGQLNSSAVCLKQYFNHATCCVHC